MSIQTVRTLVKSTLAGIGAPCEYIRYTGGKTTYFVFHIISDTDIKHGDGKPLAARYRVQIDRYSKDNRGDLDAEAKTRLQEKGFRYLNGYDFYEDETELFRRMQEFYYYEEE